MPNGGTMTSGGTGTKGGAVKAGGGGTTGCSLNRFGLFYYIFMYKTGTVPVQFHLPHI